MADTAEAIVEVPKELVENSNGFSIDFGSSVLKLVYRSKDDWEELQNQDPSIKTAKLRLLSYSIRDYKEALDHLNQHCYMTEEGKTPQIFTTGVGCYQNSKTIKNALKVKIRNLPEYNCFVKSFCYLAGTLSRKDFEYETTAEMGVKLRDMDEAIIRMLAAWNKFNIERPNISKMKVIDAELLKAQTEDSDTVSDDNQPVATELPDMYPCILAMIGSAVDFYEVKADGSFQTVDNSQRGGRTFLGLGSLLLGTTTSYSKLLELAVKGNNKNVDISRSDIKQEGKAADAADDDEVAADMYSNAMKNKDMLDYVLFCLGKAASSHKDAFKPEDMIRSLLNVFVMDLVQSIQHVLLLRNVRRCFVCGSFTNHHLVRDLMSLEFRRRKAVGRSLGGEKTFELHFIKIGAYLGALGAIIEQSQNISGESHFPEKSTQ